jgi:hypothetical protein
MTRVGWGILRFTPSTRIQIPNSRYIRIAPAHQIFRSDSMKAYQVLVRYALIAALVGLGADQPALAQGRTPAQPTSRPSAPSGELIIYEDALAEGWQNWSWNTQVDFANAQPALGRRSRGLVTYRGPYSGFSLRAPAPIDAQRYSGIAFWVHGWQRGAALSPELLRPAEPTAAMNRAMVQLEAHAGRGRRSPSR